MLHIHVSLQDGSAEPTYLVQYHVHVALVMHDENSGRPRLHQCLYFPDKVFADPSRGPDGDAAGASHRSADGRTGNWSADYQPCEESHGAAAHDVGGGRKLFTVERKRSVGVPHGHCNIVEHEIILMPP